MKLQKIILSGLLSLAALATQAQNYDHHFLLAGASFAVPENGWFELVCDAFNAEPLNKAVGGDAIKHTASDMFLDRFYTTEELDRIDVFIIMHVHNQDVASTNGIKENYEEYTYDEIQQYNTAYDYVIKRYKADCYNLKFNPESRYYQTENGKPATIILCTHWHDSRITYNQSIRTLAERWQLPLIEWDENIGFTRKVVDADGRQPSIKYAADTEKIYDITFGWHPMRGKEQYIQQKIASIAMEKLTELFTPVPASVELGEKSKVIVPGEQGYFVCRFTGVPPWSLTYTVNGEEHRLDSITTNPLIVEVTPTADETTVLPVAVSNRYTESGIVAGEAHIYTGRQSVSPTFDTYVHQANQTTAYTDADHLEVKGNTDTHTREAYLSFATTGIDPQAERMVVRAYYYDCIYPSWPRKETHPVEIWGNTESYTTMTWNTKPDQFTRIGETLVRADELNSYIEWDVTDWAKTQIEAGASLLTFKLCIGETDATGLLYFYSSEAEDSHKPQLLVTTDPTTGLTEAATNVITVRTRRTDREIIVTGIDGNCRATCYTLCGQVVFAGPIADAEPIALPHTSAGVYLLDLQNETQHYTCKIIL
ncbi:DUF5040 domain-containing protein [uncultured Barnesiella sp.]|uniref:DUF5040 domain-containing protein n=1 Tax=uncultured Barnesiella sp. TaxID=584861 RepID=UPI0026048236|nr:DUF5040 domain-containing protein [uncultured Barnesiella sp.]